MPHLLVRILFRSLFILFTCHSSAQELQILSLKEIRERGVVMQKWENSCAAATIATVLTYAFYDPVSERYAATKMLEKTDPKKVKMLGGFSLLDLKKFVEDRGYQGRAFKKLAAEDLEAFSAPIVPINFYGNSHYVVFNGIKGGVVFLADPAFGNREIPLSEFKQIWTEGMAFVVSKD